MASRRAIRSSVPGIGYSIGLTGSIGTGKSTARNFLAQLGCVTLDMDTIAHKAYEPGREANKLLVAEFGDGIRREDGFIDRAALGSIVFGNQEKLAALNGIVWPQVAMLLEEELRTEVAAIDEAGGWHLTARAEPGNPDELVKVNIGDDQGIAVVEAAFMVESGSYQRFDEIWVASAPKDEAVRRVMARNGLTEDEATARVEAQPTAEERVEQIRQFAIDSGDIHFSADSSVFVFDTTAPVEDTQQLLAERYELSIALATAAAADR